MWYPRKRFDAQPPQALAELLLEQFGLGAARYAADRLAVEADAERRRQWREVFQRVSELIEKRSGRGRVGRTAPPGIRG